MLWTLLAVRRKLEIVLQVAQLRGNGRGPLVGEMGRPEGRANPQRGRFELRQRRPQSYVIGLELLHRGSVVAEEAHGGRTPPQHRSRGRHFFCAMASPALDADCQHAVELRGNRLPALPLEHLQLLAVMVGVAGLAIGGGVRELVDRGSARCAGGIAGSRSCAP